MKNKEIVTILNNLGHLLEIQGENVFKIRAYFKAADNINNLSEDIAQVRKDGRLGDISGVGKAIQEKIGEYLDTGRMEAYRKAAQKVPESVLDVMHVPSVGPKKAKLFYDELKVKDLESLRKAAESGKLLELPGIKQKTLDNILAGVRIVQSGQDRMDMSSARAVARKFITELKKCKGVENISAAGSLRRGCETVGDIDILIAAKKPDPIMKAFVELPHVQKVNAHGKTKSSVVTDEHVQVDLRIVEPEHFGSALLYFTGSKSFNIRLRQIAKKQKKKVSEYGIFSVAGKEDELLAAKTEKACLKELGLPDIPPELREEIGEERIFENKRLPKLIELKDIKGELHTHSTYSDGKNSIEEMARTARDRGYEYLALSDHSQKLRVANGLSIERLKEKMKEIAELNKKTKGIRILCGSEVEIDTKGNLDYNDAVLSELDIVVGAVHTHFQLSRKDQTRRLVRACQNKHVNILAHPFGVHMGKREAYDVDFKEVCQAAVDNNVFLEINAFPIRLDLNSAHVDFAKRQGVKFVINTDAHSIAHFDHLQNGVTIARRGWLEKGDVLNTLSLTDLLKHLKKK